MTKKAKVTKKIISVLIVIAVLMVYVVPAGAINQSEFDSRLNQLRSQYPDYSTWDDYFDGGHQCWGFARLKKVLKYFCQFWIVSCQTVLADGKYLFLNKDNRTMLLYL